MLAEAVALFDKSFATVPVVDFAESSVGFEEYGLWDDEVSFLRWRLLPGVVAVGCLLLAGGAAGSFSGGAHHVIHENLRDVWSAVCYVEDGFASFIGDGDPHAVTWVFAPSQRWAKEFRDEGSGLELR